MTRSKPSPIAPASTIAASIATATAAEIARDARRRHRAAQRREDRRGEECAEGDEEAVAEVEHVHQAEHQRQAGGGDEDDHAHRQAGDRQREPGRGRADQRPGGERDHGDEGERAQIEGTLRDRLRRGGSGRGGGDARHRPSSAFTGGRRAKGRAAAAAAPRRRRARPSRPRWTTRPSSITATLSPSACATAKFCSTSRIVVARALELAQRRDQVLHDRRREALARLVDQAAARRGSTIARAIASICFCPPESLPAG